jgi:colanic acid/amylovoran biosynthesis protein
VLIEIKGVQFVNKGAALMLRAVVERLSAARPSVEFALTPGPNAPFQRIAALGAWQRLRLPGAPLDSDALSYRLPERLRRVARRYGVVTEADVDAVLDASGFAYGSAWGDAPLESTAREIERLARHGKPYVFLPQAFGPFAESSATRRFGRALARAALVCARDDASRDHLNGLAAAPGNRAEVYPDFTLTVPGVCGAAAAHGVDERTALLIPNAQMQGSRNADAAWHHGYLPLMQALARRLVELGYVPRVLNHEGTADASLCDSLRSTAGAAPVITVDDPLALKGIIGAAGLAVCSRYHGCASALSQLVPCLATAWSHKYRTLFADFGVAEYVVESCDEAAALASLDALVGGHDEVRATLEARRPHLASQIEQMWQRVDAVLGTVTRL